MGRKNRKGREIKRERAKGKIQEENIGKGREEENKKEGKGGEK